MSWTTVFPILTNDHLADYQSEATAAEKSELNTWFGIKKRFNQQSEKSEVVAFSLFWKNATASSPDLPRPTKERMMRAEDLNLVERFHPWNKYVKPLFDHLPGLVARHPGVAFRIYLARDLDFLIDDLVELGCEVYWMKHPSLRYCPGGLWRYLAYEESRKLVTISDTDRIAELDADIERTRALKITGHGAWRVPLAVDFSIEGNVSYCPMLGGQLGLQGGMPISRLMKAFVWHSRRGSFPEICEMPGCGPRRARGSRWPDYWFDQWFLTTAIYPRIARRGMVSFIPTTVASFLLPLDIEYAMWANPGSEIVYFGGDGCCGGKVAIANTKEKPAEGQPALVEHVRERKAAVGSPLEPRVALLFLTRGDVNHPKIWREYVDDLGEAAAVYSHPKSVEAQRNGFLDGTAIKQLTVTHWGDVSLVRATLAMLAAAAADDTISHFMLLSESCIPVRPADHLIRSLRMDPRPRLKLESHDEVARRNPDKAGRIHTARRMDPEHWFFHDQWMLLDRRAVSTILHEDVTDRFEQVFAADESYFGSVLSMAGWNMKKDIIPRCPTWTQWAFDEPGPSNFDIVDGSIAADVIESGCYFARKFTAASDVNKWNLHRGTQERRPAHQSKPRPASIGG